MLIGDFNVNVLDKNNGTYQFLEKSCKYLGLRIKEPGRDTRNEAILDLIICGKDISIEDKKIFVNDHQRIKQLVTYKQRDFQLFSKLLALDDPSMLKETINDHWR